MVLIVYYIVMVCYIIIIIIISLFVAHSNLYPSTKSTTAVCNNYYV